MQFLLLFLVKIKYINILFLAQSQFHKRSYDAVAALTLNNKTRTTNRNTGCKFRPCEHPFNCRVAAPISGGQRFESSGGH